MEEPVRPRSDLGAKLFAGVVVLFVLSVPLLCLLPAVQSTREPARRTQTLNNLRNVAIAAHSYIQEFDGRLPAGGSLEDTLPERSWQTQLLPYLEQQALYRQIDFTQAWDSPANAKLSSATMAVLQRADESNRGPIGGFGITHFSGNSRVLGRREGMRIDDVSEKDGTSQTLLMGEIGTAYPPWARPGNTRDPARGLGGGADQWGVSQTKPCAVMFVGGNGRFLRPDIAPRVLELLADPDNGVPGDDDY